MDTVEDPNSALFPAPAQINGSRVLGAKWYMPAPRSCCRPMAYPPPTLTLS
jgi:hypothetical protein